MANAFALSIGHEADPSFLSRESFYEPVSIQMLVDNSFRVPENWTLKKL